MSQFFPKSDPYRGGIVPALSNLHEQAISLRMSGNLDESKRMFFIAFGIAEHDQHTTARLQRDYAMVLHDTYMSQRSPDKALLDEAMRRLNWSFAELIAFNDEAEAAITIGFKARIQSAYGDIVHKRTALSFYHEADVRLRRCDNRDYELNNLLWMMKDLMLHGRIWHLPRLLRLIRQTGQTFRYKEMIPIILTGKRAHQFVSAHPRVAKLARRLLGK